MSYVTKFSRQRTSWSDQGLLIYEVLMESGDPIFSVSCHEITRDIDVTMRGPLKSCSIEITKFLELVEDLADKLSDWAEEIPRSGGRIYPPLEPSVSELVLTHAGAQIDTSDGVPLLQIQEEGDKRKILTFVRGEPPVLVKAEPLIQMLKRLQ
jgi:hypothetical protein